MRPDTVVVGSIGLLLQERHERDDEDNEGEDGEEGAAMIAASSACTSAAASPAAVVSAGWRSLTYSESDANDAAGAATVAQGGMAVEAHIVALGAVAQRSQLSR